VQAEAASDAPVIPVDASANVNRAAVIHRLSADTNCSH